MARCLDYYYRALPRAQEIGAKEITARTHACLDDVLWGVEENDLAIKSVKLAISIFAESPDERNLNVALFNLGAAYQNQGDSARASDYYRQSLESARATGNLKPETEALKVWARLTCRRARRNRRLFI